MKDIILISQNMMNQEIILEKNTKILVIMGVEDRKGIPEIEKIIIKKKNIIRGRNETNFLIN